MGKPALASAAAILSRAIVGLLPTERESVADYAVKHRQLSNPGGGYVGPWRHEMVPYLIEPMECLTSTKFQTVALAGPGQSSKSSAAENWFLQSVGSDPANLIWYLQTDDAVEAYVKARINPMIDAHEVMHSRQGGRTIDDSLHFKRFHGMTVEFLSATYRNLISKSAPRIVLDEIDAYPEALGDVLAMANVRRQTFGAESKVLAISHPDRARGIKPERDWTAGIMAVYADSDRRLWWWPCPHCGTYSSPAPIAPRYMALEYPPDVSLDDVERGAHLLCPVNGCVIEDHHRRAMNARGLWIGEGQTIAEDGTVSGELVDKRVAGFWIIGVMSPFLLGGIGGLARAREKARREAEQDGDDGTLRQVMVKQWGIPYTPPKSVGSIDANDLADRALAEECQLRVVAEGVRFLTVAVDCQRATFEYLVRGWGVGGESWIVDHDRVLAQPATNAEDWNKLLDIFTRPYPLADRSGRGMTPRACIVDSGGAAGVTQQAYAAWARWRKSKLARYFGKISGRDAWSIAPAKGASGLQSARLQVVYPDTVRKANVAAGGGAVPVVLFNPNSFKDDLFGQLAVAEAGPWFVHFPRLLRSKETPHTWFEQAVAERRLASGRWELVNPAARNEVLDLLVMTHVAAHLHGLTRINWERPPSWAATWDTNSTITATGATPAAAVIAKATPGEVPRKPTSISEFIDKFK